MNGKKRKAGEAFARPNNVRGKFVDFQDSDEQEALPGSDLPKYRRATNLKQRAQELLKLRQKLPIYSHADEIRQKFHDHGVLLLVGETGSGKSTQIPQFLVDETWNRRQNGVGGCIAITQPRRVAAISLARRVAEEMGTPLGHSSPASQVGYSVRFDNSTGPSTRIKFLTEGMLLQEMLRDPWLKEYSCVVVDEVHERGVNVDLVLGFLKRLQKGGNNGKEDGRKGVGLKVVVMSATADMERIKEFFVQEEEEVVDDKKLTDGYNAATLNKEREDELQAGSSDERKAAKENEKRSTTKTSRRLAHATSKAPTTVTTCHIKGRQYPVKIHYVASPVPDLLDACFQRIVHIHTHCPLPGDILVFLTGQEMVESLETLCHHYAATLNKPPPGVNPKNYKHDGPKLPSLQILPLFAALPTPLQQRVFAPTPPYTRKIILSTNIAETSITVPGIRHVLDTGKRKARIYRPSLSLDSLLTVPISRSSASQRAGRAGRDSSGECWRLYPEIEYLKLPTDTEPEILRCDLTQLVLTLKAHGIGNIPSFSLLTAPPRVGLERALLHLLHLHALSPRNGHITSIGKSMSTLPLPAPLSRILLSSLSPQYSCTPQILSIVSALSVENIYLSTHTSEEKSALAEAARRDLFRREGDHLTLLTTVEAYMEENSDRKGWCEKRFISHRAMKNVMDVRKQLASWIDRHTKGASSSMQPASNEMHERVLRCLLTGFCTNVARLAPSTTGQAQYTTLNTSQQVHIHPSSILFGRKTEAIMYSEFVFTQKTYARGVSAIELKWLEVLLEIDNDMEQESEEAV